VALGTEAVTGAAALCEHAFVFVQSKADGAAEMLAKVRGTVFGDQPAAATFSITHSGHPVPFRPRMPRRTNELQTADRGR
jgi:hypothetical protein